MKMNKNVPNILTIARIIAVPFFIWAYYADKMIAALAIFVLASLTDMLDGKIARKYNLVSNFGKFMDPLADKILNYSAFCLFVSGGYMTDWALIIVLFREFAVAGIRMLAAEKGKVIAADMFGKIKTVLQMVAVPVMMLGLVAGEKILLAGRVVLDLSMIMTVLSGYNYIAKNLEVLKG